MAEKLPNSEQRSLVLPIERRADGDKMTLTGYAAVFGEAADIGGYFSEAIERGAFTKTLKTGDVLAYFDHDRGRVLGRSSAGTLRLSEDNKGLAVEIDLPDTTDGRDVHTLVERGDITGMSFGFSVTKQVWDETTDPPTRTIQELVLYEVSVVSDPAYDGTSVALRSRAEALKQAQSEVGGSRRARIAARVAATEQRIRKII